MVNETYTHCVVPPFSPYQILPGILGLVLEYITPLTIAPSVAMIGISLFSNASNLAQDQWGIAIGTIFFIILLSQYLKDLPFPFLGLVSYKDNTGKNKWRLGCEKYYVIRLFPVS